MMSKYDLIFYFIKIIGYILGIILIRYIIPILKQWYNTNVNNDIKKIIKESVEAVEQTIKGSGLGSKKKNEVYKMIFKYSEEKGYKIDDSLIDAFIESAVYSLNSNKGE